MRQSGVMRALVLGGLVVVLGCGDAQGGDDSEGEADASGDASASASASASESVGETDSGSASQTSGSSGDTESGATSESDTAETGDTETTGAVQDYDVWELRIDNYAVPTAETAYQCFEWTATLDQLAHIVGFNPVIDNAPYVHHYVVSLIDNPTGQQGYQCFDLSGDLIWAWAPGTGEYLYPEEAGVLVGENVGGAVTVRIQVHYNNPLGMAGQTDSSGLDVYLSTDLRPNNAGVAVFADVAPISIPPGDPAFEWVAECSSAETTAMLNGPITAFGSAMHAHEIGSVLWTDIERDGDFLLELNRDDPYDFNNQTYKPIEPTTIDPGDAVVNHCIYDSTGRGGTTMGGPGTADEMCWNTVLYYPRENVNFDYCGG